MRMNRTVQAVITGAATAGALALGAGVASAHTWSHQDRDRHGDRTESGHHHLGTPNSTGRHRAHDTSALHRFETPRLADMVRPTEGRHAARHDATRHQHHGQHDEHQGRHRRHDDASSLTSATSPVPGASGGGVATRSAAGGSAASHSASGGSAAGGGAATSGSAAGGGAATSGGAAGGGATSAVPAGGAAAGTTGAGGAAGQAARQPTGLVSGLLTGVGQAVVPTLQGLGL
jgi:hypothetical protein